MNVFTYIYIYIYIYIDTCAFGYKSPFFFWRALHAHTLTLELNFLGGNGRAH